MMGWSLEPGGAEGRVGVSPVSGLTARIWNKTFIQRGPQGAERPDGLHKPSTWCPEDDPWIAMPQAEKNAKDKIGMFDWWDAHCAPRLREQRGAAARPPPPAGAPPAAAALASAPALLQPARDPHT